MKSKLGGHVAFYMIPENITDIFYICQFFHNWKCYIFFIFVDQKKPAATSTYRLRFNSL